MTALLFARKAWTIVVWKSTKTTVRKEIHLAERRESWTNSKNCRFGIMARRSFCPSRKGMRTGSRPSTYLYQTTAVSSSHKNIGKRMANFTSWFGIFGRWNALLPWMAGSLQAAVLILIPANHGPAWVGGFPKCWKFCGRRESTWDFFEGEKIWVQK